MLSVKQYQKIYALFDVPMMKDGSDCGLLCGRACCRKNIFTKEEEKVGIFLYPQEELIFQGDEEFAKGFTLEELPLGPEEIYWSPKKMVLRCNNDGACNRKFRPIQCRAYPVAPCVENGVIRGVLLNYVFLGHCPLLEKPELISPKFLKNSLQAWKIVLSHPKVMEFYKHVFSRGNAEPN